MLISAIVAMAENRVIGAQNKLPWHLPADLSHFKAVTMGKPILMGRRTYDSIGRALPGRCNVIITRNPDFQAPGCVVANSIECALESVAYSDEVFIIGGALLYEHMLSRIQRLYITQIHQQFDGDAFFPELAPAEWKRISCEEHLADAKNPYPYSFTVLERI